MSTASSGENEPGRATASALAARVVRNETGTELTLFPPAARGYDRMSRWLTASEGSWVDVVEMR